MYVVAGNVERKKKKPSDKMYVVAGKEPGQEERP